MDEEQSKMVHSAYNSASKLSKLSKTLTLITKIENQEFKNIQLIDFKYILETALYNFQELIELKDITLVQDLSEEVLIRIDPLVADMLVANLLKNAIKHNFEQGLIRIQLNKKQFIIANTGCPPKVDTETLFHRFQKNNPSSDSLGLGLAIVKKICDVNEFQIHYTFENDLHSIVVDF
jgi:signal transduction histidine kinase